MTRRRIGNGEDDEPASASWTDDFPKTDEYVDFTGRTRVFDLELFESPAGFRLSAIEKKRGSGGYEFQAFSRVDPMGALADLRKRIPRMLATRHLARERGQYHPTHDRLRERIDHGGVVIDGIVLEFEEFAAMLQSYEGFQFDLRIVDPTDEV